MFSIYAGAWDVNSRKINYSEALENFCQFAGRDGEVKIAVPTDDTDGTFETLYKWKELYHPFSNILEIFLYRTEKNIPNVHEILKNAALKECCSDIVIGADMEDRFCLWQKDRWIELSDKLMETDHLASFIPSFNLQGDLEHYSSVEDKWHLHKRNDSSINSDGYVVDSSGKTLNTIMLCSTYHPEFLKKYDIPFVFNLKYLNSKPTSELLKHNLELWK